MKKILSFLGTTTLIGTSTSSFIACDTQYTETELKKLKEENKISIIKVMIEKLLNLEIVQY